MGELTTRLLRMITFNGSLDPKEAYGNVLRGLFKHAIIQAVMIKGVKKEESW